MKKRFYLAAAGFILAPSTAVTLSALDATIDNALHRASQQQVSRSDAAQLSDAAEHGLLDEGLNNQVQGLVLDTNQVLDDAVASMY